MNRSELASYSLVLLLLICLSLKLAAIAQPLGSVTLEPRIYPAPVTGGDIMPPPPVPTGSSNSANSTAFPAISEEIPMIVNLRIPTHSHNNPQQYMGKRIVFSITPNTLYPAQMKAIANILQLSSNTDVAAGQKNICIDVTQYQLEQVEHVLDSHTSDLTGSSQFHLFSYLPTAKRFGKWCVLLGIVFATVMLSIAAYGVVMSHRGSADKIISTISGLMVLLMAYTIYNLLVANASNTQSSASTNQVPQSDPLH